MEPDMDRLKVVKHHQHARLIREEDEELWISSEDLRTEGSSDDEDSSKKTSQQEKKKKVRKLLRPVLKQSKSIDNDDSYSIVVPKVQMHASASTSKSTNASSMDHEALNLESQWRPKRGSIKLPTIASEDEDIEQFCNAMKNNLQILKMNDLTSETNLESNTDSQLFKNLKNTEEVQKKLSFIKNLDDEIVETISTYQMERNERMKQQEELCKEMSNSNERNANAFLELFGNVCESKTTEKAPRKPNKKILTSDKNNEKFIQRNIQLAKRGKMMTSSLTDEEKQKLDELLKDIDLDVEETEDEIYSQVDDEPEESSDDEKSCSNDFGVSGADRKRLEEINTELNKYSKNETCAAPEEEVDQRLPKTYKNWKEFLNDSRSSQALKEIEAKLEALCMESDDDESEVQN